MDLCRWHAGTLDTVTFSYGRNNDDVIDTVEKKKYDELSFNLGYLEYTLYDGLFSGGGGHEPDGIRDRLELRKCSDRWVRDRIEAESLQGIQEVKLSGASRGITFSISDELRSVLAGTNNDYSLVIDSSTTASTVRISGDGIDRIDGDGSTDS